MQFFSCSLHACVELGEWVEKSIQIVVVLRNM